MLLNFTAKNYKSFADEMNFSMVAAPKQNDLSYSLFKGKAGGQDYKVQCSSVVYGANASGKSNIISAMDTFKAIILRGNIKNCEDKNNPNIAAYTLEFIPNIKNATNKPVEFAIEFFDNDLLFKYILSLDIGPFLGKEYNRKIISEELYLNSKLVFKRSKGVELGEYKFIHKHLLFEQDDTEKMQKIANSGINAEELFLTNGFKVIFSPELANLFTNWISKNFTVIFRADCMELIGDFSNTDKKGIYVQETINKAAKIFGANANKMGYFRKDEKHNSSKLVSILKISEEHSVIIPSDVFESYGTVRFANLFPLVLKAFANGATLVIDEFDASIHPSALMNIINMFHNDSINKNHAQLIFNTHNPIFLNSNLFRRDEIKFVQRNHDTGNSELYALSDFGTSGKKGVRNSTDYMKYYLDYSYGAIEDVDFTPVFENIVGNGDTENNGGE